MIDKNTGGAAFPHHFTTESIGDSSGITTRDYFAARAMQSLCANRSHAEIKGHINTTAKLSYAMADAMLSARENT